MFVVIGWKPLTCGWIKLNNDGSCKDCEIAGY